MRLSLHTDYSLRVLLMLAVNPEKIITLSQIAETYQISKEHLRKVVHALSKSGVVNTYQGKNGGIELKGVPEQINIGETVKKLESTTPIIDCHSQPCILTGGCDLRAALAEAENAFYAALSNYTLAHFIAVPKLISILNLSDNAAKRPSPQSNRSS